MGASPNRYGTRSRRRNSCMQVHALSPAGSLADKPLPRAKFNARSSFLFYVPDYASEVATSLLRILLFQPTFPTNFNIMYLKYSTIIFRAYYYYQIYHLHTWEFSRQFRELGRIRPQRVIVHYTITRVLVLDSCAVSYNSAVLARGC